MTQGSMTLSASLAPAVGLWRGLRLGLQRTSSSALPICARLWPLQQQAQLSCRPLTMPTARRGATLVPASSAAADAASTAAAAAAAGSSDQANAAAAAAAASQAQQLQLYNTLTRQKEAFRPRPDQGNRVSMYVCGVTVYDYSHIGHARVYVAFDSLFRLLSQLGYEVTYVRNFTDVDDKIIARAAATGEDPLALSRRFISEFHADMELLGCLPPTQEPKATDYIPQMIAMIQRIIDNGHAYAVEGDVYFDVGSLPGYGRLSGRSQEDNRAGERVAVDARKRGPADFVLWKAAKPGEPTWDSPWGAGRPGWHIECSAMIKELLGPVIDIHGGGRDLVFPHHENELAQSRAAEGACCSCGQDHSSGGEHGSASGSEEKEEFVRYWVHNGFVNVDSEKMSKSLGNFFTIREVVAQYHPRALRWFLLGTQYRQPVNYTQRALEEASDRLYYLYQTLADAAAALEAAAAEAAEGSGSDGASSSSGGSKGGAKGSKGKGKGGSSSSSGTVEDPGAALEAEVMAALLDDLNTPLAVAAMSTPLKAVNDLLHTKKGKKQAGRIELLQSYQRAFQSALSLMGLWTEQPAAVLAELKALALTRAGLTEEAVAAAIQERAEARQRKDYAASDEVRLRMEALGVMFMDTPEGTVWKPGPRLNIAEEENAAGAEGEGEESAALAAAEPAAV